MSFPGGSFPVTGDENWYIILIGPVGLCNPKWKGQYCGKSVQNCCVPVLEFHLNFIENGEEFWTTSRAVSPSDDRNASIPYPQPHRAMENFKDAKTATV